MPLSPPRVTSNDLEPSLEPSPVKPDFLGYTARSWQAVINKLGPVLLAEINGEEQLILCNHETDRRAWKAPEDWLYGAPTSSGKFFLREMGNTHITQQDGDTHRRSRKLLLPGFGINAISRDIDSIAQSIAADLAGLSETPIDLHAELCATYTRALSRSQVKEELGESLLRDLTAFEEWFIAGLQLPHSQQLEWHQHPEYLDLKSTAFRTFDDIAQARLQPANNRQPPQDTLQELLNRDLQEGLSPLESHELRNVVYLLLLAGVGNIANLACCMVWALNNAPQWQAQLDEELAMVTLSELPGLLKRGLKQFPILQATIFETERCFLPAPVVQKTTTRDLDVLGYHVRAGTHVQQMIGLSHFDDQRYPNAREFEPKRWLNNATPRANAYGGGTHLCLGMGVSRVLLPLTAAILTKSYSAKDPKGSPQLNEPRSVKIRPDIDFSPRATQMLLMLEPR